MAETRQLTIRGRYECIPAVTNFVGEAAAAAGLDDDAAFHCKMAVDEACTNVIEHAYDGEDKGAIQITCEIEAGTCTIEIVDHGKSFDPTVVPEPHEAHDIEELVPGGIGLHLMRKMMDQVSFRFEPERNVLTMTKRSTFIPQPQETAGVVVASIKPNVWLVAPEGRLDAAAAPALDDALDQVLQNSHAWVMIDMRQVTYISSRGLKTFVSSWRRAGDQDGNLVLFGMLSRVAGVLDTVGFTHLFDIYVTLDEAVKAAESKGY